MKFNEQLLADLKATRQVIAERGWIQRQSEDKVTGQVCLARAIGISTDVEAELIEPYAGSRFIDTREYIENLLPAGYRFGETHGDSLSTGVVAWNDEIGRTKEEVLAILDQAIKRLELDRDEASNSISD